VIVAHGNVRELGPPNAVRVEAVQGARPAVQEELRRAAVEVKRRRVVRAIREAGTRAQDREDRR
jgi:hypothetical protein